MVVPQYEHHQGRKRQERHLVVGRPEAEQKGDQHDDAIAAVGIAVIFPHHREVRDHRYKQ